MSKARRSRFKLRLKPISLTKKTINRVVPQEPAPATDDHHGAFNEEKMFQISEHLYMSGYKRAKDLHALRQRQIGHVFNLSAHKCGNHFPESVDYTSYSIRDNESFDLKSQLSVIVNQITRRIREGKRVLVHCKKGVSRAPSVIIAYLILEKDLKFQQAYDLVRSINCKIEPNFGFLTQLMSL